MTDTKALTIAATTDREILMSRRFQAPPQLLFDAFTKPELVSQWLLGPPGWTMPVCEIDLRVGGAYRYVWRGTDGTEIGVGGVFREITPPERLVATEKYDMAWYPGDAEITMVFEDDDGATWMKTFMKYESKAARDAVLASPMESGVSDSYDRLDTLLARSAS